MAGTGRMGHSCRVTGMVLMRLGEASSRLSHGQREGLVAQGRRVGAIVRTRAGWFVRGGCATGETKGRDREEVDGAGVTRFS